MSDIKTLDERLRERAQKKLMDELKQAAKPLFIKLQLGNSTNVNIDGQDHSCHELINKVIDAIYARRIYKAEKEELDRFISKVDGI